MRNRLVAVLTALAVALLLAACGSSPQIAQGGAKAASKAKTTPAPAAPSLTVDKQGFGGDVSDGFQFWTAGAIVTNQSKTETATLVIVTATAKDANGQVVGTGQQDVTFINPGQQAPIAIDVQATAQPASVEVLAAATNWVSNSQFATDTITGSGVQIVPNDDQFIVNANLSSTYPMNLENVSVLMVCMDASGNIMGGGESSASLLPANGTTGVQIVTYGAVPATCSVVGYPTQLG